MAWQAFANTPPSLRSAVIAKKPLASIPVIITLWKEPPMGISNVIKCAVLVVNLVLWLGSLLLLKTVKLKQPLHHIIFMISRINMFLFIFNMLPIPGFDGWSVWGGLIKLFF